MGQRPQRVARLAAAAALAALVLPLALSAVVRLTGGEAVVVRSGSMGPAAPTGSLALLADRPATAVEAGDVVLVPAVDGEALPTLHRAVSVRDEAGRVLSRTKGDANAAADPSERVLPERVGVLRVAVPFAGYVVAATGSPIGRATLVLVPAWAAAAAALRRVWRRLPGATVPA